MPNSQEDISGIEGLLEKKQDDIGKYPGRSLSMKMPEGDHAVLNVFVPEAMDHFTGAIGAQHPKTVFSSDVAWGRSREPAKACTVLSALHESGKTGAFLQPDAAFVGINRGGTARRLFASAVPFRGGTISFAASWHRSQPRTTAPPAIVISHIYSVISGSRYSVLRSPLPAEGRRATG